MAQRIILHLDLDYFFAQAEEVRNPDYKNKPLVICVYTDATAGKGAVATANYIARKFGVHSGMPIFQAKKLLEDHDATFLAGDYDLYQCISNDINGLLALFSDKVERASVDEWFIDITEQTDADFENAKTLAQTIKKEIFAKHSLTCSIGIAPNKLVAKIASNFQKPDGLTIVKPEGVQSFLDPLEITTIPGIGKKTKELLAPLGISKVADIRKIETALLVEKFGKLMGGWLYRVSRGIDSSEIITSEEQKQISRIATLKHHSRNLDELLSCSEHLVKEIIAELKKEKLKCGTVGVLAIDAGMRMHTRAKTLQHPTESLEEVKKIIAELFNELIAATEVEFRRVGVKVEKLESKKGQKTLEEF